MLNNPIVGALAESERQNECPSTILSNRASRRIAATGDRPILGLIARKILLFGKT
jgi:hypothetical protein